MALGSTLPESPLDQSCDPEFRRSRDLKRASHPSLNFFPPASTSDCYCKYQTQRHIGNLVKLVSQSHTRLLGLDLWSPSIQSELQSCLHRNLYQPSKSFNVLLESQSVIYILYVLDRESSFDEMFINLCHSVSLHCQHVGIG